MCIQFCSSLSFHSFPFVYCVSSRGSKYRFVILHYSFYKLWFKANEETFSFKFYVNDIQPKNSFSIRETTSRITVRQLLRRNRWKYLETGRKKPSLTVISTKKKISKQPNGAAIETLPIRQRYLKSRQWTRFSFSAQNEGEWRFKVTHYLTAILVPLSSVSPRGEANN